VFGLPPPPPPTIAAHLPPPPPRVPPPPPPPLHTIAQTYPLRLQRLHPRHLHPGQPQHTRRANSMGSCRVARAAQ